MRILTAVYRIALRIYPRSFRETLGPALLADFVHGLGERRSVRGRVAFLGAELVDLLRNLPAAWRGDRAARSGTRRSGSLLDDAAQDLRYAFRGLRSRPGFAAVVVLTLGLGIGSSAAVFGVIDSVLLEPLPYADSDQLVYMVESYRSDQTRSVSHPNYLDWRARNRVFQDVAARTFWSFTHTGDGAAEELSGLLVSANLLPLLGVAPSLGRLFTEEEELREDRLVLLGAGAWERRFGSDPAVLGRTLTLNDEPWTVVGVLPHGLEFPVQADVYAPLTTLSDADQLARGSRPGISAIGRLTPRTDVERARGDMDRVAAELEAEYPGANTESGVVVETLRERYVGSARPVLTPLLAAVVLVFLIACANVTNLFLVRGQARAREAAVRAALGGQRRRIVRTYLAEAGLLAVCGALLGAVAARGGIALLQQLDAAGVPRLARAEVDGTVLLFAIAASVLATLLVGALPAWRLSAVDPARVLAAGGGRGATFATGRVRAGLVAGELGLSFVLLAASGLMLRSMVNLGDQDPHFAPEGVLTIGVPVPQGRYPTDGDRAQFIDEVIERVSSIPGIAAVAAGDPLPLGGNNRQMRTVAAEPNAIGEEGLRTDWYSVTPSYFATMGIPFVEGTTFEDPADSGLMPVVVDRYFAERFWPGESALGRQVRFSGDDNPWLTVTGVAEHVTHYGPRTEGREQVYVPHSLRTWGQNLVIRSERDPAGVAGEVRTIVAELDPLVPLRGVTTLESLVDRAVAAERLATRVLGLFAAAALGLAMLGLYGVVSYWVGLRAKEIGLRIALGAHTRTVVLRIAGSGLGLAGLGLALGLVAAAATTRLLGALLYGVEPTEVLTLASAGALMVGISGVASLIPALKAARLDPARTLRAD